MDGSSPATASGSSPATVDGTGTTTLDRSDRRARARRIAEVVLFAVLGAGIGLLLLLVPAGDRSLTTELVLLGMLVAATWVVVEDQRRLRGQAEAHDQEAPAPEPPLVRRLLARRLLAVLFGVYLTGLAVMLGSWAVVVSGLGWPVVSGLALVVVRRSRRRELAAARAAHPGAAVVLVAMTGLASMRLAQWAKATRTTLPASLGGRGVLVADCDGVLLLGVSRTRPLPRWGWDEVGLRRGPHPDLEHAAAIVLTLLGPVPADRSRAVPVARRRFDVHLSVRESTWIAPPPVVDAAVADLLAQRPAAPTSHEPERPDGLRQPRTVAS